NTYRGRYQFVGRDMIECKAVGKPSPVYDGKWRIEVTDDSLKIDRAEIFQNAKPAQRITRDDPKLLDAAKAKLIGRWALVANMSGQPKNLIFGADGSMEVDDFPRFKGTYQFIDDSIIYIGDPNPGLGAPRNGLRRVVVDGETLRISLPSIPPDQATA